jgi:hypothetical protein
MDSDKSTDDENTIITDQDDDSDSDAANVGTVTYVWQHRINYIRREIFERFSGPQYNTQV